MSEPAKPNTGTHDINEGQRLSQDWWRTEIIDMQPGEIRYRGYPIEQLIGQVSFAQIIWLMLRERHLGGTIILADAHIRYSQPISGRPSAVADLGSLSGDLDRLARGRKARVQLQVELFGDERLGAVFEGIYIVLPAKPFGPYEEGGNEEE